MAGRNCCSKRATRVTEIAVIIWDYMLQQKQWPDRIEPRLPPVSDPIHSNARLAMKIVLPITRYRRSLFVELRSPMCTA